MTNLSAPSSALPGTPNVVAASGTIPQSPDPLPLLTLKRYQQVTGDKTLDQADFTAALADCLDQTAMECKRTWLYGQYTEMLYLYKNGMVFPSATPIDINQSVVAGAETYNPPADTLGQSASVVQGAGIWVGWFTPLPFMPIWTGVIPPQTQVTYWGGWTQATVPAGLARMWSKIIYYMTNPTALQGLPGGAKSLSIGGIAVGGDLSSFMRLDHDLRRDITRWTRRQGRAWER